MDWFLKSKDKTNATCRLSVCNPCRTYLPMKTALVHHTRKRHGKEKKLQWQVPGYVTDLAQSTSAVFILHLGLPEDWCDV